MAYTSKDVKVLSEIEHIRTAPEMYIGSTETPVHLVEEAMDNALDEMQAGHASIIAVNVDTKTGIVDIIDNGRGIPLSNNTPVTISTKLFSGAKFKGKKTAYEISSGMHGVGLVTLTALSEFYKVEIYRNGQYAIYDFKNSKLKKKKITKHDIESDKLPFSTKITFKASKEYFEKIIPDINRIRSRLTIASAELPKKNAFVLTIDDEREIFRLSLQDYFGQNLIKNDTTTKVMAFRSSNGAEKFNIMLTYSKTGSVTPRVMSSINLLPVSDGGVHVNVLYEILREIFIAKAKKLGYNFKPQDCLVGFRGYLMLSLKEPKFSSQTKNKLTNRKVYFEKLIGQLKQKIEDHLTKDQDLLIELLDHFQAYRRKLDSKNIKVATNGKRAATKFTKLRDCTSKNGELFIVEGDSAGGGFVECRNPKIHAILPLRGKIPSAATAKDIIKNKEISELIGSLGTGIEPNFDISKLKYKKVLAAMDADSDGYHIFCLVTIALAMLVPEVIKNGNYYFVQTPLYAINEKKSFIPLWNNDDVSKAKSEKRHITRIKGLGELNPEQLEVVAVNEKTRRLIPVTFTSNIEKMVKLFSDSSEKRRLLEGEWHL